MFYQEPEKGLNLEKRPFQMCYFKSVPMQRYPLKNANRNRPQRYTDSFLFQGLDVMVIAAMWRFIKSRATCILHFIGFCCKSAFSHKSCHTGDIIPILCMRKLTLLFSHMGKLRYFPQSTTRQMGETESEAGCPATVHSVPGCQGLPADPP